MKTKKYVKINADRGYGSGMFAVVGEDSQQYELYRAGQGTIKMSKAHTFEDRTTKAATVRLAQQTGVKK